MNNIAAIFKKEFRSYFNSPIAYIFITFFLALSAWFFFRGFFIISQANMRGFFTIMPWLYLFFVPAVTMKLWAEERKLGTVEILMTLPIRDYEVVLGKYLASFALLGVTILLSLSLPIAVASLGDPDGGPIFGGYIGLLLMGAAYLSIGLFASTLTENQIISFHRRNRAVFCTSHHRGGYCVIQHSQSVVGFAFQLSRIGHSFQQSPSWRT